MARETKVGLLAGLAFIICFAIILANGGRQKPATTHLPYLVDQGTNVPRSTQDLAYRALPRSQRRTPAESSSRHQPSTAEPTSGSHPARIDRPEAFDGAEHLPGSGAEVALPTRPLRSTVSQDLETDRSGTNTTRTDLPPSSNGRPGAPGSPQPSGGPAAVGATPDLQHPVAANTGSFQPEDQDERQRALQELLDRRTSGSVRQAAANGSMRQTQPESVSQTLRQPPASQRQTGQLSSARYKVKPGDTLSRIAFAHYGSRSTAVVDGIFEANRSTLSSPDLLPVGADLVLPVLDGFAVPPGSHPDSVRRTTPAPSGSQQTAREPRGFRWYQVERNDRYVSIAREQLGDERRWREIFELNKDKFPDPDRIRHGVRIKLPLGSVASAGVQP